MKALGKGEGDAEDSTYAHHRKDATFMIPSARVLQNVVDQLDEIDVSDADTKGDLYGYMLGKIASAGQSDGPGSCWLARRAPANHTVDDILRARSGLGLRDRFAVDRALRSLHQATRVGKTRCAVRLIDRSDRTVARGSRA